MKSTKRNAGILSLLLASIVCVAALAPVAHGQEGQLGKTSKEAAPLLQEMAGTWDVKQRMWLGAGAEAINLPPTIARRRLIEHAYLQEIMELVDESEQGSFTRTSYINYDVVKQRYEYFSIDSRAPQQMNYESEKRDESDTDALSFKGGDFVAAQWGEARNVAFKYRLNVGNIKNNEQVVRLYLTPQAESDSKEFLAFEYVYTRRR